VEKGTGRTSAKRIVFLLVIGGALCAAAIFAPRLLTSDPKPPAVDLKMGGTSAVEFLMNSGWRTAYRKAKQVEVGYDSIGSTKGINGLVEGKYSVGFTHAPMTEEQRKKAQSKGEILHIPVALCAVVPLYNVKELKGKPPLNFTGEALAGIFLGEIDRWDHPALQKLNPGATLPATKITVIHREGPSGTTLLFTSYLEKVSPQWRTKVGAAADEVKWPVGVGAKRTPEVEQKVRATDGAIGYVDLLYAAAEDSQYGAVQNKDGTAFIHAAAKNMTAAAKDLAADLAEDLTFQLTNRPGKESYPICGGIWAICYQAQPAATQKKVVDFLQWITHDGQELASRLSYAPLPAELIPRVEQKLQSIKASGS
jgi:phosphate transport system substrate-binding protein